jgi:hypothetical protein
MICTIRGQGFVLRAPQMAAVRIQDGDVAGDPLCGSYYHRFKADFRATFESPIADTKLDGRYRRFTQLERIAGEFASAFWQGSDRQTPPVTVWCRRSDGFIRMRHDGKSWRDVLTEQTRFVGTAWRETCRRGGGNNHLDDRCAAPAVVEAIAIGFVHVTQATCQNDARRVVVAGSR